VNLILEVTSPPTKGAMRHTFQETGGTIGRESNNSWVLPHSKVSGNHAVVSYRAGTFYIEDRSRNGVYLNSSKNRLQRGREQGLKSGDRILIEPYEIRVSISRDQHDRAESAGSAFPSGRPSLKDFDAADPFGSDDPFAPRPMAPSALELPDAEVSAEELDPLALLNLGSKNSPQKHQAPNARDLDRGSLLESHYQPPSVVPDPAVRRQVDSTSIPEDYDPLADDAAPFPPSPARVDPPRRFDPAPPPPRFDPEPPPPPKFDPPPVYRPLEEEPALPPMHHVEESRPVEIAPTPRQRPAPPPSAPEGSGSLDFGAVLSGAGLDASAVTPEVAREFGQILRVVVSGVMDVMRSRQQIKDEFRMQGTRVRRVDNNPLKFSANVDDALHNLLLKRNAAYMSPVEAFEDAFVDLRNHQIAMLAGMRTAFESMLAEFEPDRLQEEFDRQLAKGLVPAKLRYWDSYRERQQQAAKDPEATFRRLFGEEFARAYEDQLRTLKSQQGHAGGGSPNPPKPPET
jgi:type VI secretion system FHA domain protein